MMTVTAIAARAALATPFTPAQLMKKRSFSPIDLSLAVTRKTEVGLATRMTSTAVNRPIPRIY